MPATEKILVLSTSHVTKDTATELDRRSGDADFPIPVYAKGGNGYFIAVVAPARHGMGMDLSQVFARATEQGCTWVMLDRDADSDPALPSYEW